MSISSIHQGRENIVLESVITLAKGRWEFLMQIKNEIAYQITMKYLKQMLEQKLISKEEYHKLSDEFKEKYTSKISHLFLENR